MAGYLTPAQIEKLNRMGGLDDEQEALVRQLRAQRERPSPVNPATTPTGALIYGAANIGSTIVGKLRERRLSDELRASRATQAEGRAAAGAGMSALPAYDPSGLYSADPAQQQSAQAALAEATRGRRELGGTYAASGDPVVQQMGAGLLGEAKTLGGYGMDASRGRFEIDQRLAAEGRVTAAEAAKNTRESGEESVRYVRDQAGREEVARIAAGRQDAARGDAKAERAVREAADRTEKTEKELDRQVETLSKRTEHAPALKQDLATLQKFAAQEDIPGVGVVAGRLPGFALSDEGTRVRQAARGIVGTLIKQRSGTAAGEKEVDRILDELGMGDGATEQQFRLGLRRLTEQSSESLRSIEAGATPKAVEEARRRGLTTSADIPTGAPAPVPASTKTAPRRTDPATGETRVWDGKSWVKP